MNSDTPVAAAIEADIERTREDLADTVDQLSARLDVKSRIRSRLTGPDGKPTPAALAAAGGLVAALTVALVLKARRR